MLTLKDKTDFQKLDGVVRDGIKTFIEVGTALCEIRDRELWKQSHQSFTDYAESYGWSKTHAYRLIDSAKTAISVSPIGENVVPNEAQARELSKAGDHASEAWERAQEMVDGGKITAEVVKAAVRDVVSKEADDEPISEEEAEAYADEAEYEDADEWQPDDVIEVADGAGEMVEGIADWEILSEANDEPLVLAMQALRKIHGSIKEQETTNPWMKYAGPAAKASITSAINSIKSATCAGVCSRCGGVGCDFCHDTGYLSADEAKKART